MLEDKYVGLSLAIVSTLAIGTSFVITKKGLLDAEERHGFEGDGFSYLKSPVWWGGICTMVLGEISNFAAYAFAPAILVTPLGALSVLIGAVLGSYFLKEKLGLLGKIGCATCLIGAVIIVLHAPPDEEVETIERMLELALAWPFLIYCATVAAFSTVMIYKVAPEHGRKNPLIYISICSAVGSVSIMAIKAFGIAVKLTFGGNNQFTHPSTYVFAILVVVCILTQMNYFNKALATFSTNIVNPLYYVTFTTATLCASFILFKGFNTTSAVNTISLLCGFLVIFTGVYLLNLSRKDPDGDDTVISNKFTDAVPTDSIAAYTTRRSMQARRSSLGSRPSLDGAPRGARESQGLMRGWDEEQGHTPRSPHHRRTASGEVFGLGELTEDDDEDDEELGGSRKRTSFDEGNGHTILPAPAPQRGAQAGAAAMAAAPAPGGRIGGVERQSVRAGKM